ncbi:hypothetical protein LZ32DRAFT_76309 [Colletotrichum eremochloae]|nr:hypothetical protein LZ32DRAFT_76309 [Colletotrichum eremochloae]
MVPSQDARRVRARPNIVHVNCLASPYDRVPLLWTLADAQIPKSLVQPCPRFMDGVTRKKGVSIRRAIGTWQAAQHFSRILNRYSSIIFWGVPVFGALVQVLISTIQIYNR